MIDKIIDAVNDFFSSVTFNPKEFVDNKKEEAYYNEANLQHELSLYLKQKFQEKIEVRLEYPVNKLLKNDKIILSKKEIDIIIKLNKDQVGVNNEFLIIELKFPKYNAGMPLALLHALNDIQFCEQIKESNNSKNIKLHFATIFLTDNKRKWTKREHIYKIFKLDKDMTNVQFTLPKEIIFINSIETLRKGVEEIKKRITTDSGDLDYENWVTDNKDIIKLKSEHEIKWEIIDNKWLYYICKF